jgi:hypothetical protein
MFLSGIPSACEFNMKLNYDLQQKLKKQYNADSLIELRYKGLDLVFKTDHEGNPVVLFIGRKSTNGKIKGERYTRTLKKDSIGNTIKDHWDLKGNTN